MDSFSRFIEAVSVGFDGEAMFMSAKGAPCTESRVIWQFDLALQLVSC